MDVRDQENDIWIWEFSRETLTRFTTDPALDEISRLDARWPAAVLHQTGPARRTSIGRRRMARGRQAITQGSGPTDADERDAGQRLGSWSAVASRRRSDLIMLCSPPITVNSRYSRRRSANRTQRFHPTAGGWRIKRTIPAPSEVASAAVSHT